jgi:ubiquinone/menaquinone biosynthesis C-methylase UbiE
MRVKDATQRFSSRVDNYVRYRPDYPAEILDLLKKECGLRSESVIADIASGTGIFTRMLVESGNRVFGVEPNDEMRRAGERLLGSYSGFTSVAGKAEATTLPDHSVDFVTAAQAAHWFDRENARREFIRILKPGGWTVLLWNERRTDSTPFLREYEHLLLTYGTDYHEVRHEHATAQIGDLFAPSPFRSHAFEMRQEVDYSALEGRLLSSSYVPTSDHANYDPMLRELRRAFEAHQVNDHVALDYNTLVYYGQLD